MKKFKLILKIAFLLMLILIVLFVSYFVYIENFQKKEVCSVQSPDGDYEFVFYQIGSPGFPFGSVTTQISIENKKGKVVDKYTFELINDGSSANGINIKDIRWLESTVEIDIKGADEQEPTIYSLKLK